MDDFLDFIKLFGGLFLGIFLFILVLSPIRFNTEQGGTESGYVVAVDQEGIFYPNYHIFLKNDTAQTEAVDYCINLNNKQLADQLKEYGRTKQRVEIEYTGVRGYGWHLCGYEEITAVRAE